MRPSSIISIISTLVLISACGSEQPQERTGESIYYQSCVSCHERGHGGAPIRGESQQWQSRLKKSKEQLLLNLRQGYKTMPPKGACYDCTDEELRKALSFILHSDK